MKQFSSSNEGQVSLFIDIVGYIWETFTTFYNIYGIDFKIRDFCIASILELETTALILTLESTALILLLETTAGNQKVIDFRITDYDIFNVFIIPFTISDLKKINILDLSDSSENGISDLECV